MPTIEELKAKYRLDQLLAEIEKRGYVAFFGPGSWDDEKVYGYYCEIVAKDADITEDGWGEEFRYKEMEDTIASALIWILERGKE